jgi:hypothetical protein
MLSGNADPVAMLRRLNSGNQCTPPRLRWMALSHSASSALPGEIKANLPPHLGAPVQRLFKENPKSTEGGRSKAAILIRRPGERRTSTSSKWAAVGWSAIPILTTD